MQKLVEAQKAHGPERSTTVQHFVWHLQQDWSMNDHLFVDQWD